MRLEKEAREMEKTMESLRHAQAKATELEKTTKKLHAQSHADRKDIIKLKEENEVLKVKASRVDKLQVELSTQRERLEEANRVAPKLKVVDLFYKLIAFSLVLAILFNYCEIKSFTCYFLKLLS